MKKTGLEKYKSKQTKKIEKKDVNLQDIANEYKALMLCIYGFVLSNGEYLEFRFKKDNFYHLLGFHKITDITIYELVETNKLSKSKFFDRVLCGDIKFDQLNLGDLTDDKIVKNLNESSKRSKLDQVIQSRFLWFTEEKVLELFGEKVVIDYESDKVDSIIEADKIFYKMNSEKQRNLNLFIGYDKVEKKFFATTFFLEMKKNNFKYKSDGKRQDVCEVLVQKKFDLYTKKLQYFKINWSCVRKHLSHLEVFRAQTRLESSMKYNMHIESEYLIEENSKLNTLCINIKEKILELENDIKISDLIKEYLICEKNDIKEKIQLKLMDYDIDLDDKRTLLYCQEYHSKDKINDVHKKIQKKIAYEDKIVKYKKFLPDLKKLEIEEVKYIYRIIMGEQDWEEEFISMLINEKQCFKNSYLPQEIEKFYYEFKITDGK